MLTNQKTVVLLSLRNTLQMITALINGNENNINQVSVDRNIGVTQKVS